MPKPRTTFLQRLIRWRYLFVVNFVVLLFLGMTFGREYMRTREIQKEINQLQSQADELTTRNISLSELKTAVQTESYIEREARLKLGLKKPGEEVVVIQERGTDGIGERSGGAGSGLQAGQEGEDVNRDADPLGLVLDADPDHSQVANATKWWYYFFDKSAFVVLRDKQ